MTHSSRESCCEPGASLEKRVDVDSGVGEVAGVQPAAEPGFNTADTEVSVEDVGHLIPDRVVQYEVLVDRICVNATSMASPVRGDEK